MAYFFILAGALLRVASHFSNIAPFDVIGRYLPHIPNFAPIAAMALFAGVYLNKKYALLVALVAMFISDIFIGFYSPWLMTAVYGSFLLIGLMGLWLKYNKTLPNIIGATLLGSVLFFAVTNFAMWLVQPYMPQAIYPQTLQGLVDCYTMGLPFFRNTLMGDLFYVSSFFGLMELAILAKKSLVKKVSLV